MFKTDRLWSFPFPHFFGEHSKFHKVAWFPTEMIMDHNPIVRLNIK